MKANERERIIFDDALFVIMQLIRYLDNCRRLLSL